MYLAENMHHQGSSIQAQAVVLLATSSMSMSQHYIYIEQVIMNRNRNRHYHNKRKLCINQLTKHCSQRLAGNKDSCFVPAMTLQTMIL